MAFFPNWLKAFILSGILICTSCQEIEFEHHLEHLETVRNPSTSDKGPWINARNYIFDQFRSYNLKTEFHEFSTTVMKNNQETTVTGKNVVGIAKGPDDAPIILVGADYDTGLLQESPLEDNGSGVAALLEIASHYMSTIYFEQNYTITGTVIFVAFDINTKEYDGTSAGQSGAYHFIHQYLWRDLKNNPESFNGAIILDSISKYNTESKGQIIPVGFDKVFPGPNKDITRRGFKGDFLALITRQSEHNSRLSQTLIDHYNKDRKSRMFRLLDLTLKDGDTLGDTFNMLNHQSHYPFWTFQPSNETFPLPAVLLTDTDMYRKAGHHCDHPCTAQKFLTKTTEAFMAKTVETVVQTLGSLQTYRPHESSLSSAVLPSTAVVFLLATLSQFL